MRLRAVVLSFVFSIHAGHAGHAIAADPTEAESEARFAEAERLRRVAEAIATRARAKKPTEDWSTRKRAAVLAADRAYVRVLGSRPLMPETPQPSGVIGLIRDPTKPEQTPLELLVPLPRAIAALSRIASMWSELEVSERIVLVPVQWSGQTIASFRMGNRVVCMVSNDVAYECKERAIQAARACYDLAVRAASFDSFAENCELILGRYRELRPISEIRPIPFWGLPFEDPEAIGSSWARESPVSK
ncbi:hypothetical protein AKJ09_03224 [Labilithrix luteola]|uniref:Uncharacterized protein n=1 Tax=Labilithrix luteola TaxID=1391654 RepID=A0A0K1PSP3_9BACT|nr:hypothetical protein [Labilithrix luteola]AKU96560.1 hypothetical protein AKJ09_03224 [Labilithrix luteola]